MRSLSLRGKTNTSSATYPPPSSKHLVTSFDDIRYILFPLEQRCTTCELFAQIQLNALRRDSTVWRSSSNFRGYCFPCDTITPVVCCSSNTIFFEDKWKLIPRCLYCSTIFFVAGMTAFLHVPFLCQRLNFRLDACKEVLRCLNGFPSYCAGSIAPTTRIIAGMRVHLKTGHTSRIHSQVELSYHRVLINFFFSERRRFRIV